MRVLSVLLSLILISSCANKLTKQSPERAKSERFYRLSKEKGVIYHQRCKSLKEPRECKRTFIDLNEEWDFFRGEFIVIPLKYVFP